MKAKALKLLTCQTMNYIPSYKVLNNGAMKFYKMDCQLTMKINGEKKTHPPIKFNLINQVSI